MNILLDCDGILSNFSKGVLDVFNKHYGTKWKEKDIHSWDMSQTLGVSRDIVQEIAAQPNFCLNLDPYPEGIEAAKELGKIGDVWVVTSPLNSKTWMWERNEWVGKHVGIDERKVIHTGNKKLIKGAMLVDDKPKNVEEWNKEWPDGVALLFDRPWNQDYPAIWHAPPIVRGGPVVRVKTWAQVLGHARSIKRQHAQAR